MGEAFGQRFCHWPLRSRVSRAAIGCRGHQVRLVVGRVLQLIASFPDFLPLVPRKAAELSSMEEKKQVAGCWGDWPACGRAKGLAACRCRCWP